jgi:hypothetical protein
MVHIVGMHMCTINTSALELCTSSGTYGLRCIVGGMALLSCTRHRHLSRRNMKTTC